MKRDKTIDIIKCLGIILMVLGHSGFIFTRWIYQFHMALFFIVAGYCFKESYSKNKEGLKALIISRIKSLYIPCLLFNSFIAIFHNLFVKSFIITGEIYSFKTTIIHLAKCLLFSGGESLSGAMWFLRTLFLSTILFGIVHFMVKNNNILRIFIFTIFTYLGFTLSSLSFGKYFSFLSVMILLELGFIIRKKISFMNISKHKLALASIIGLLGTIIPLFFVDGAISLKSNSIVNPIYFVFCSIMGFIFIYGIARIIKESKLSNIMVYIGNHTLPIVMFHYLAMKIVTLIGIVIYNDNIDKLANYPYAYTGWMWCILYTVAGIVVPLVVYYQYNKIKLSILKKRKKEGN